MEKINLWEYVQKHIHAENKEESLDHQCPLAYLLQKKEIESKNFIESKPFPKKIDENIVWGEVFPWMR